VPNRGTTDGDEPRCAVVTSDPIRDTPLLNEEPVHGIRVGESAALASDRQWGWGGANPSDATQDTVRDEQRHYSLLGVRRFVWRS
jgi:hypothetical protein